VNLALASQNRSTILAEATRLDQFNNLGCPIDAHGNPIGGFSASTASAGPAVGVGSRPNLRADAVDRILGQGGLVILPVGTDPPHDLGPTLSPNNRKKKPLWGRPVGWGGGPGSPRRASSGRQLRPPACLPPRPSGGCAFRRIGPSADPRTDP